MVERWGGSGGKERVGKGERGLIKLSDKTMLYLPPFPALLQAATMAGSHTFRCTSNLPPSLLLPASLQAASIAHTQIFGYTVLMPLSVPLGPYARCRLRPWPALAPVATRP